MIAQPSKYYQLIPGGLAPVLTSLIEKADTSKIKGFDIDCLREVISIVASQTRKDEGAAPLKSEYIAALVPQGDKYLRFLLDAGIVQRQGRFIPGELSYKYRFADAYQGALISGRLKSAKLAWRKDRVYRDLRKAAKKAIWGRSEQTTYLNKLTIADNFREALRGLKPGSDQYNSILASAVRIHNGEIFYSIDNTSGRFHSNITNLAKELRPYLRINGEPLCNIDIKNSQPYLSTIILTDPGKASTFTENAAFALLLQSLRVSLNEDVKKYIYLVASGSLYEYLMNEFAAKGLELTRSEVKTEVLRILFARNRMPQEGAARQARQIFRDCFPTVYKIFAKVRGAGRGDKFQNFKRFPILLQRIEAFLMLDIVLKRIYKELPGTIAVTVHDSVMTGILTNDVEAVRKIMTEELTFFVGIRPQIKIEGLEEEEREKRETSKHNHYDVTTSVNYDYSTS